MNVRLLALSSLVAVAAASQAGVLTNPFTTVGNQTGYSGSAGMAFNVGASALTVSGLGAYDSGLDGFAAGTTITVGIFDRTTQTLVGSTLTFTDAAPGTLVSAWREKSLATPFTLAAGGQYMIVASGFDRLLNTGIPPYTTTTQPAATNSAASQLTFVGTSYYNLTTPGFAYPTVVDSGPAIRYGAGNFTLAAPVPEPTTIAALGLGALGLLRRRRKA